MATNSRPCSKTSSSSVISKVSDKKEKKKKKRKSETRRTELNGLWFCAAKSLFLHITIVGCDIFIWKDIAALNIHLLNAEGWVGVIMNLHTYLKTRLAADHRQIAWEGVWSEIHDASKERNFLARPMIIYLSSHWKQVRQNDTVFTMLRCSNSVVWKQSLLHGGYFLSEVWSIIAAVVIFGFDGKTGWANPIATG